MTPEGKVKAKLKKSLSTWPELYQYWPVPGGFGATTVDVLICWRGSWVAIECKRAGVREPTPQQAAVMKQMRAAGAKTWLVTANAKGDLVWIEQVD
ncbi:MAG TPA: hypothetical protein VK629_14230 [Steroidobacteraceae bacterium]|nr:hypothetical protein [Steroidobacteraceae bacterium]